jgi:hypothetical protein
MNQPAPVLERRFNGLVTKIHSGECVLVLGPRIAVPSEVRGGAGADRPPIEDHLSQKLLEDLGGDAGQPAGLRSAVARYERERGTSACRSLIQELVSEFDRHTTELHRDLALLPFRLVLSTTPDRMMLNAFRSGGKPNAQEACYNYCRGISAESALSPPSSESPIVYSLFGRHDQPESMVLNDKNLLDYLVRIVKETPALPDAVRATLRAPSTVFLFIGFGFTNWWLRLLLKVLEVTGVENRGLSLALEDNSSFDAAVLAENRGFFESVGIYIQTRDDWSALAKHLAATFHQQAPVKAADSRKPSAGPVSVQGRPLVFLSYASEDAVTVDAIRAGFAERGVSVWLDKQNLRSGQNWKHQIERVIGSVDYFIFVQSANMDRRDQNGEDGVYNWELKEAIARQNMRPFGAVFLLHATIGTCRDRPEPELAALHRAVLDGDIGLDKIAQDIIRSYDETRKSATADVTAQAV